MIWTTERRAELRRLYLSGYSALRVSEEMFRSQHYRDAILGQIRRMGLVRTVPLKKRDRVIPHVTGHRVSMQERAARLAEVPPDHRNLTGRLLGDPLPGRSALDREANRI